MEEYAVNLVWAYIEYAKGRKLPYWISARGNNANRSPLLSLDI